MLRRVVCRKAGSARFFSGLNRREVRNVKPQLDQIQAQIEGSEPDIELLAVEEAGGGTLRLLIDRPDGVDLATCQRVTDLLGELRERYSLEVSSPGPKRPLVRPEHFERFVGRTARIRTREPVDGQRNFTGTITGVDPAVVTIEGDQPVSIPFDQIERAHLVPRVDNTTRSN